MKRIWLFAFLLLAFAVPAGGADGTWTNGVGDQNWADAGNWSGVAAPGDGETATFDGNETDAELPAANQPGAGTIHFVFTGAYDFVTGTQSIEVDILGSAGAAIGNITVNNVGADIVPGANFGSTTCTLTTGYLSILAGRTCTGDIVIGTDNARGLKIENCTLAVAGGTVEMQAGAYLDLGGNAAILDLAEPMRIVADGNHIIYFDAGEGDIYGGIDASSDGTARQVTIALAAGAGANIVQCDVTGDLDLGTDGAGGLADWSAVALDIQTNTVTMAADANVYGLTVTSGELAGAAKTITADAGGFTFTNGTISDTLDVDLSGAAGAYTQTAGTIAAAAVLNVTTGTGGFTFTDVTKTGAINITVAASGNGAWLTTGAKNITRLTINSGITLTQTDIVRFARLDSPDATATLAGGANQTNFDPGAATDWGFLGTISGTGTFLVVSTATPITFTLPINISTRTFHFRPAGTAAMTLAGLTSGPLLVTPFGAGTATLTINGNSSGTTITLGADADKFGVLTLGPNAVHKWTGAIAAGGGASNALNPQGRCIFTGTFTGTDIVVTPTHEGAIDCFGTGRVTAVTSTGRRLVVRRAVDAAGNPVRSWNGDVDNVNVRFLPRKVIGAPGVN